MWANILSRVARTRRMPAGGQPSAGALRSEPEPVEVELTVSLHWFLRLRWLAVIGVIAAVLLARYVLSIQLPLVPILAIATALAVYNLVLNWLTLEADRAPAAVFTSFKKLAHLHILLDLAALTALLHFAGGVENPFSTFYIFHVVVAGIFLSRLAAFAYAVGAIGLIGAVASAEAFGVIPHYHLEGIADPSLYQHAPYVAALLLGIAFTLLFVAYLTSSIGQHLRLREVELELANERLQQQTLAAQEANAKLEKLAKVRSAPTLLVAHELRAPLAAIQGLMDVTLQGYITDPNECRSALCMARDRAAGLIEVVNDLLCLGQIREIGAAMATGNVNLAAILDEIAATVSSEAAMKGLKLDVQMEPNLPHVRGNREQLAQLLINLIDNAIKYTPSGGKVSISLRQEGEYLAGEVRDTGIGIAPADQERVFDDFYRAENAKQVKEIGTGLGMGIVKRVIELHAGKLTVRSRLGEGTAFTFSLPVGAYPTSPLGTPARRDAR